MCWVDKVDVVLLYNVVQRCNGIWVIDRWQAIVVRKSKFGGAYTGQARAEQLDVLAVPQRAIDLEPRFRPPWKNKDTPRPFKLLMSLTLTHALRNLGRCRFGNDLEPLH